MDDFHNQYSDFQLLQCDTCKYKSTPQLDNLSDTARFATIRLNAGYVQFRCKYPDLDHGLHPVKVIRFRDPTPLEITLQDADCQGYEEKTN